MAPDGTAWPETQAADRLTPGKAVICLMACCTGVGKHGCFIRQLTGLYQVGGDLQRMGGPVICVLAL